jgi:hypothetical protein
MPATITSPGVLSAQVLRLLTRDNLWSGVQSYNPDAFLLVSDVNPPADPSNKLYNLGGNLYWNGVLIPAAESPGTVSSVGLAAPAIFAVTNSPVVSTGTLTLSLASQQANYVWAGPTTAPSSAAPTFRALVAADIPPDAVISVAGSVAWVAVDKTSSSLADLASRSASDLTTGLLALARLTNGTTGSPLVGGASAPAYGALDLTLSAAVTGLLRAACFPILTGDVTTAGGTLVTTLAASGAAAGTYGSASAIPVITVDAKGRVTAISATSLTGAFAPANISGAAQGAVLVGNSSPAFAALTPTVTGSMLAFNGTDSVWSTDGSALTNLSGAAITGGAIPITGGGTGLTSVPSDGELLIGRTSDNTYVKTTLTGTVSQITVTNAGGSVTLATPQAIATGSAPQFARLGLGTGADASAALYTFGPHKHRVVANASSGTAATLDFATADVFTVTLTGNCTFTFSNPIAGVTYHLVLLQDGTGSRTVVWPTVKWAGGAAPVLTTTVAKSDIVTLFYDGTSYYGDKQLNF